MKQMSEIIADAYLVTGESGGNDLILEEEANVNKGGTLYQIKLNVRDAKDVLVYKFDQTVLVDQQKHKTYAPFLQKGEAHTMCDFIIFYRQKRNEQLLHAWVVNLKSSNPHNNLQQMRAGRSLCKFLLDKLNDLLKIQDKPEELARGEIDYVLFALSKTRGTTCRPRTSPLLGRTKNQAAKAMPDGKTPENCITITTRAYNLRPLDLA